MDRPPQNRLSPVAEELLPKWRKALYICYPSLSFHYLQGTKMAQPGSGEPGHKSTAQHWTTTLSHLNSNTRSYEQYESTCGHPEWTQWTITQLLLGLCSHVTQQDVRGGVIAQEVSSREKMCFALCLSSSYMPGHGCDGWSMSPDWPRGWQGAQGSSLRSGPRSSWADAPLPPKPHIWLKILPSHPLSFLLFPFNLLLFSFPSFFFQLW